MNQPFFKICHGCTRLVFLIGNYAIKIPQIHYEWRHFLKGLLGNMQEKHWWKYFPRQELCPVLWASWGGWILIMPRAKQISDKEVLEIDLKLWKDRGDWVIPAETKFDSFGWIDGRLVAIDYGD